jgi:hypothetical protein
MDFFELLAVLLGLHALADYPLQGAYLSSLKYPGSPDAKWLGRGAWKQGLVAHSQIHGLFVGIATGSLWLGLAETVAHGAIDYAKSRRWINSVQDQGLHYLCKAIWAALAVYVLRTSCPLIAQ